MGGNRRTTGVPGNEARAQDALSATTYLSPYLQQLLCTRSTFPRTTSSGPLRGLWGRQRKFFSRFLFCLFFYLRKSRLRKEKRLASACHGPDLNPSLGTQALTLSPRLTHVGASLCPSLVWKMSPIFLRGSTLARG